MTLAAPLPLPFEGLKVLDVSQGIAGPYCGQILWQQGADVIKVEPPVGDWGRGVGVVRGEFSALAMVYNAGKRSLALDATGAAGRALLRELALQADVVIQNYRPGVAQRLTIGADDLLREKPGLVYVSVSGYGPDGPFAALAATDSVVQADSGLMHSNRGPDGEPRKIGLLLADVSTGLYAAQAASAALYRQARTGRGAHVEVSLFEGCATFQAFNLAEYCIEPDLPARAVSAPNGSFAARDGRLNLIALDDAHFVNICAALERPEWLADPRFQTAAKRLENAAIINGLVGEVVAGNTRDHWIERLRRHDVLHAPIRNFADLLVHPQAQHRQTFQVLRQPVPAAAGGASGSTGATGAATATTYDVHVAGLPDHASRRPAIPAPAIGEHSRQILLDAGVSTARVAELIDQKVVVQR